MSLISGDPNKDFFEQNPEIEYFSEVRAFIKKHGKKKAGKYLWATYMTEDPNSKLYKGTDLEERRKIVSKNFLNEEDFNWGDIEDCISFYPRIMLTKEEVFFDIWARKLDEIKVYFNTTSIIDFNDVDKLLKAMNQVPKLIEGYEAMKNKMIASQKTTKVHGGKKESASESGAI